MSFPVDTNHLPQVAKRKLRTQLSCRCSWYLSDLFACSTYKKNSYIEEQTCWSFKSKFSSIHDFSFTSETEIHMKNTVSFITKWKHTSTCEFSIPTANHSPVGQYPKEKICELKSCCCNCFPSRKSQLRTVLSNPPVQSFVPSELISIHEAPSVCPCKNV